MKNWWAESGKVDKNQVWKLSDDDKVYFEKLTGRMPILLSILASILLSHAGNMTGQDLIMTTDMRTELRSIMIKSEEVGHLHHRILQNASAQVVNLAENPSELKR